jgi:hypothetical protein
VSLPGRRELPGSHIRPANAPATSLVPQGICRPSSQLAVGPMMLRLGLFYVGPHRRAWLCGVVLAPSPVKNSQVIEQES